MWTKDAGGLGSQVIRARKAGLPVGKQITHNARSTPWNRRGRDGSEGAAKMRGSRAQWRNAECALSRPGSSVNFATYWLGVQENRSLGQFLYLYNEQNKTKLPEFL